MKFDFERVVKEFNSFNIKVLTKKEDFVNTTTKMILVCPKCSNKFNMSLNKLKNKKHKMCENCSRTHSKSIIPFSEAKKEVEKYTKLISIHEVVEATTIITIECTQCSAHFDRKYNIYLREAKKGRTTCKNCGIKNRLDNLKEKAKERIESICKENNIPLVKYGIRKSTFICDCGDEFDREPRYLTPDYSDRTMLCPKCSKGRPSSTVEDKLSNELSKLTTVETNNRTIINPKEIDIYLPEYNLGIEVNGLRYHSELAGKDRNYHLNKTISCELKNIQLLQFWDIEIINKFELVLSMIKSKMGILENTIYARKTIKKEIDNKTAKQFFENNHIDGFVNGQHFGLFFQDTLVSAISIGKSRFSKNEIEVLRFATIINHRVIGGFSKLTAEYSNLISFANRRFSTGNVYEKSGWIKISETKPSYWYFKNKKLYHRSTFMKHKLSNILNNFDSNKTEWENMKDNKWDRVWDCGTIKYKKG